MCDLKLSMQQMNVWLQYDWALRLVLGEAEMLVNVANGGWGFRQENAVESFLSVCGGARGFGKWWGWGWG